MCLNCCCCCLLLLQALQVVEQVPPLLREVASGTREFTPAPEEVQEVNIMLYYTECTVLAQHVQRA
jgi:hypothetical protein